ncbi:MAG: transcriptional regulator [Comamonadaceae bacterium]|nr:MAG: transcriptional regulator [Comamonadaceae bacterium]
MESATDLNRYGVISQADMTRMKALCDLPPEYPPERVVSVRTRIAKMSQAVFASFLNVSVSTVQKWESPTANKHPSGAAAKLLQLVESKGVDALIA